MKDLSKAGLSTIPTESHISIDADFNVNKLVGCYICFTSLMISIILCVFFLLTLKQLSL